MSPEQRHLLGEHGEHDPSNAREEEAGATVELRQEELAAHKQTVEAGRVGLGTEVVEERQSFEVPVAHDEVILERRPVAREPDPEPISAAAEVVSVPVREERVSVEKQPVVYEEIEVGTRAVQETQRVSEAVRKEVVDVDATGDLDVNLQGNDAR